MTRRSLLRSSFVARFLTVSASARSLFDGKTFDGWQLAGGGIWTIEDGAFVGRFDRDDPGAGYVLTRELFRDFELRLEFWISEGGNSGVFIREPQRPWTNKGEERPAHSELGGHEVQINYADRGQPTGMIYGQQHPAKVVGGEERWNRMRIVCSGSVTEIYIEDQLVNTYRETKIQPGVVGLQIHGGDPHDHIVKFRNITIVGL